MAPAHNYRVVTFDLYCQIHKRVCDLCYKYFPKQVVFNGYRILHEVTDEEEAESDAQSILTEDHLQTGDSTDVVIVRNLFQWLQSEFNPLND